jgi:hypothetical protein
MGTLRFFDGVEPRTVPLAPSTLVGRSWACIARLEHPAVPLYWLEVRWYGGAWAWRVLAGASHTRGAGSTVGEGWRSFLSVGGRAPRVTLDDGGWIELIDDSAPEPFVVDAFSGAVVPAEILAECVELRDDGLIPLEAEGDPAAALADGQVFRSGDRVLRAHVPSSRLDTDGRRMHLGREGIEVGIDVAGLVARFSNGPLVVDVRGECVRVLAAYHRIRERGIPDDGWVTPSEVFAEWVALGGNEASSTDRMGWERAKLRSQLARAGVGGLQHLFEVRRDGETVRSRIGAVAPFWIG